MWKSLGKYRDFGLLLLRVGVGAMFLLHGGPKLLGGPERWEKLGAAMNYLGVYKFPVVWGALAGASEFFGGLCLILGLFFRPACLVLAFTMAVAANMHLGRGDGLQGASHAIEVGILFLSLVFIGPGRHSVDRG
ncbi:quinol oxidase [Desulfuromonas versatilis]|uniref:Quinol oxidase n=1 Tax=Desulfuromonas versatilis TaxID=2802975 RepID=A0ABN6E3M2_9BACT|nr:DoxX family protein [Desulfuromonas versatilis]BCR06950.1 quinol oxidase [Desulfuromonas versatilis]